MATEKEDLENGFEEPTKVAGGAPQYNRAFYEAAALLTIWSLLVIHEGIIRFLNSAPTGDLLVNDPRPTRVVLFLGGLFEIIFGIFGLFVGAAALIVNTHSPAVTKACMMTQTILGWYAFPVFVFIQPALKAGDLATPMSPLTLEENRFLIAMGILTSASFCLSLQGGQFVFMARLVSAATNTDFLRQASGARMRSIFWNGNLVFAGLWTVVTGGVVHAQVGRGLIEGMFAFPPNVVKLPGLTIFTGLLMMFWGFLGIFISVTKKTTFAKSFFLMTSIVYLFMFLNYTIVQLGLVAGAALAGPAVLHAGLIFMVLSIGPYFVWKQAEEEGRVST